MSSTVRRLLPWFRFAAIVLVVVAVWLPRGLELDRFVTPDEPTWLTRSANFYHALSNGDLENTKQYVHPGVTTMWAGAAAFHLEYPAYARDATGQIRNEWRNPLILFAVLFTVAYSIGAKKFDRYLIPVYLPLDFVAAFGWFTLARWLWSGRSQVLRVAAPVLMALAVAVQASSAISTYPYYLTYYNPLMGGAAKASEVMMVGWGERLDQVAEYLNEQPDAEQLTVVTTSWAVTLAYLFDGTTQAARFVRNEDSLQQWHDADYYVLYISQLQRERVPPELQM